MKYMSRKLAVIGLSVFGLLAMVGAAHAQKARPKTNIPVKRISLEGASATPRGTSAAVWTGDTLYFSGWLDPDRKSHSTTELQTVSLLKDIDKFLKTQGLTLADAVMLHVYLRADPAKDNRMDFVGMQTGYKQFFGTKEQPNKPARTTVQVVLPAADSGALIEIDLIAVRP
ncbi:MAG: Rid family hydrolase [Pyrinomonadaceae bacterium]